jgi:hypothetical protein
MINNSDIYQTKSEVAVDSSETFIQGEISMFCKYLNQEIRKILLYDFAYLTFSF